MSQQKFVAVVFCGFLVALAHLLAGLAGAPLAILVALASGLLVLLRERLPEALPQPWWGMPLLLGLAAAAGIALIAAYGPERSPWLWLAPLLAFGSGTAVDAGQRRTRRRCHLCNRALGGEPAFVCPRCELTVCDRSCWDFDQLRCRLCRDNGVPVFPPDGRWWDRAFGPRFARGHCQLCLTGPETVDLRTCQRCGRPQCRNCWDMNNGQCSRCRWIVPDLPPRLAEYLDVPAPERSTPGPHRGDRPA